MKASSRINATQYVRGALSSLLAPIRAFRAAYLPIVLVYFSYGALGLVDVSRDMWIKESLKLSPADLAGIGVWLSLPWTMKMVVGELVDSLPILGSQRSVYIVLGAVCTAAGLVTLAGAAGGWLTAAPADQLYVSGAMLIVIGTVVQDVVADAMSTEVVQRTDSRGEARPEADIKTELGMVQVLGRLSLSAGILSVAGLSGWLASFLPRETVFLSALVIPLISIAGITLHRAAPTEPRSLDLRILGGGLAFGTTVLVLAFLSIPFAQEITFAFSMVVICAMLAIVTRELDPIKRRAILFTSIIIFAFRASPSVGDGYFWWTRGKNAIELGNFIAALQP